MFVNSLHLWSEHKALNMLKTKLTLCIINIRSFTNPRKNIFNKSNSPTNQMTKEKQNNALDHSESRNVNNPKFRINGFQGADTEIRNLLDDASCSKDVLNIIRNNMHRIKHVSIFGKAMKQCKKERKWGIVIQIMELAVKSEVDLDSTIHYVL
eukprot:66482_1